MSQNRPSLAEALTAAGLDEQPSLLGMHLSEVEEETENILELLILVRTHARTGDAVAGEGILVELTTALEHLLHHTQEALPMLRKQLDLELDEDELDDAIIDPMTEEELQPA